MINKELINKIKSRRDQYRREVRHASTEFNKGYFDGKGKALEQVLAMLDHKYLKDSLKALDDF